MKLRTTAACAAAVALSAGLLVSGAAASASEPVASTGTSAATSATPTTDIPTPEWVVNRLAQLDRQPRIAVRAGDCDLSPKADCADKDMRHYKNKMKGKDMSYSDMAGSDMRGMDLRGTDFTGADLTGAKLQGAKMDGTILTGAMMKGVNLSGMKMDGAMMKGVNLVNADLSKIKLTDPMLKGAVLSGVKLKGAKITGADMRYVVVTDGQKSSRSSGPSTRARNITSIWSNATWSKVSFQHSWISGVTATNSTFRSSDFWLSGFFDNNFTGSTFYDLNRFETSLWSGNNCTSCSFGGFGMSGSQFMINNNLTSATCSDRMASDRKFMSVNAIINYSRNSQDVYVGFGTFVQYDGTVIDKNQWWFKAYRDWFNYTLGGNTLTGSTCDMPRPQGAQKYWSSARTP